MDQTRMVSPNGDLQWSLSKYARYLGSANPSGRTKGKLQTNSSQNWKLYEGGREPLVLTITHSHHLIITQGRNIQENHSLWNAQQWMKGISKEDSILIIYKIQDDTRQFRIKFAPLPGTRTGVEQCTSCISVMSKYFMFKKLGEEQTSNTQESGSQQAGQDPGMLTGQVPIRKLAQVLTGQLQETLPKSYQTTHLPTHEGELTTLVQLCLTDSNFPGFVGAVNKALGRVIKETE